MGLIDEPYFRFCGVCGFDYKEGFPAMGGILMKNWADGSKARYCTVNCWPKVRFEREGTPFVTCRECGNLDAAEGANGDQLSRRSLCFSCNFWQEWVERDEADPLSVRVDGCHYHIGDEKSSSSFRGFGGRLFSIRFFDGREVTTTNLWCQSDIPTHFRDRLPDNAEFVTP